MRTDRIDCISVDCRALKIKKRAFWKICLQEEGPESNICFRKRNSMAMY
jgi:hypothetical protein